MIVEWQRKATARVPSISFVLASYHFSSLDLIAPGIAQPVVNRVLKRHSCHQAGIAHT